jgi:dTDP-4-dehydrorhamnose reductase
MNILLIGNTGQLGWELQRALQPFGSVAGFDYPEINLADIRGIRKIVQDSHPQVIFNASAYTDVDKAEREPELAWSINGTGPGVLAEIAKKISATLIHYSTDYVFDGKKGAPYVETDVTNPLNVYGKSKLAGEQAIQAVDANYLIFRTAWVYSLRREGFVTKVLKWARQHESLRVVDDQISNPTWARSLAEISVRAIFGSEANQLSRLAERIGLYHLAGDGFTSRYDWAKKILQFDPFLAEHVFTELLPAVSSDFPTAAVRPAFSAMDCTKFRNTFGFQLPPWEKSLTQALGEFQRDAGSK